MFRRLIINIIKVYQAVISPFYPPCCRFYPTCSQYAIEAISRNGVLFGAWLSLKRILRCHPFGETGYDPVPKNPTRKDC